MLSLLKKTASEWMEDDASSLGAVLAYYTVFSLAPLLTIAIVIAEFFFGKEAAQGQIDELRGLLGQESGKAVQEMVQSANAQPTAGIIATMLA
jgi:membrane protein